MGKKETEFTSSLHSGQCHSLLNAKDARDSLPSYSFSQSVVHIDQSPTCYRNELELRIIGMMRSGNHAVIQWIQRLHEGRSVVFLNNLKHGDYDPFKVYEQLEVKGFHGSCSNDNLVTCKKDVLIYSYEDRKSLEENGLNLLSSVFNEKFAMNRELYLGESKKRMDIFIIRDPFNFIASRLIFLRNNPMGGLDTLSQVIENWKLLADKALQLSQAPADDQMPILYNKFIRDKNYQRRLCQRLQGNFVPASLQTISGYGGGSSFSTTSRTLAAKDFVSKAHKLLQLERWMQIKHYWRRLQCNQPSSFLTRWKLFAADQEYRQVFRDPEILWLSEKLFGEIPGTRKLVKEILQG